jgi:hypothetical protein
MRGFAGKTDRGYKIFMNGTALSAGNADIE